MCWKNFGGFGRVWGGLERVWEDFGDEILKPLAKRGTAGGLRSALLNVSREIAHTHTPT